MNGGEYFIGLDLGMARDNSALVAVERVIEVSLKEGAMLVLYNIRHLQTFPLGTTYSDIVGEVSILLQQPELRHDSTLVVDKTGLGSPVIEMFENAGINPTGITITGGQQVSSVSGGYNVPKSELVDALAVNYQNGRIKISPKLPEAKKLEQQINNFTAKIKKGGREIYEALDEQIHDDLVLALSLAIWLGNREGVDPDDFSRAGDDEERNENYNYLTGELE